MVNGQWSMIMRYLLVLSVVVTISLLFPNLVKFKYEFESGKQWRYDDLEAPFDFAIQKTDAEITAERNHIIEEFSPTYVLDFSIKKRQIQVFKLAFEEQLQQVQSNNQFQDVFDNTSDYLDYGEKLLGSTYERGIIHVAEVHKNKGKDFVINIIKGNTTHKNTLQNLLSSFAVIELLKDSLPLSKLPEPEFLLPLLENRIQANLIYNDTLSQKLLQSELDLIPLSNGMVRQGELIVKKMDVITEDTYQKLLSYKDQYEIEVKADKTYWSVFAGYFLLTTLIVGVLILFLQFHAKEVFERFRSLAFILMWLVLYSYLVYAVESTELSAYLIPYCIVPIVIKNFFNERLALFTHIVIVLIASFLSSLGYEFTFLQILAGIVAVLTNIETRYWSKFFISMLYIFLTYTFGFLGLSLIKEGSILTIDWSIYKWFTLNIVLTLLAYPLIPLLERLFGFISSITLAELSDMNRPLLKQLSIKAPGTMQHSLQVANLSEAAASSINANPLLVKVAALYHDIGKMLQPEYYIENQRNENPHDQINGLDSTKIILAHVNEGVKMAKKNGLPPILIEFIKTHHGTTRVEYFYRNFVKDNPDREFDESIFRYPGPKPTTKEQTILMLADSIEAACKSLKNPSGQDISQMIDTIVNTKIDQYQFESSKMTFEELEICKNVFNDLLRSIYHIRIEYPKEVN